MDQHPIPQDITGFQFKLIGNMTIKQFIYLTIGAIIGWIFYSSPLFFLIKYPLAIIAALAGAGFAFVPIGGRSMDTMVEKFVKAMFSPTQFIYEKRGGLLYAASQKAKNKKQKTERDDHKHEAKEPVVLEAKIKEDEKKKEMVYFSSLSNLHPKIQPTPAANPIAATPHAFDNIIVGGAPQQQAQSAPKKDDKKEREMEAREQELEKELALAKKQEASVDPAIAQKAHQESLSLEEELRKTIFEKNKLEQQLVDLNRKLEAQKNTFYTPSLAQEAPKETKNVRSVPKGLGNAIGLPITPDSPNIISGIVKDPRQNPLPNILVEVKDGDSNPVRAFKTNGVGQFASATPLVNGVYTMDFEDPKEENKFDSIRFEAKGEIILPVEVISTDKREELRRELFN